MRKTKFVFFFNILIPPPPPNPHLGSKIRIREWRIYWIDSHCPYLLSGETTFPVQIPYLLFGETTSHLTLCLYSLYLLFGETTSHLTSM